MALIAAAVAAGDDPRAGELAVRLAYSLAASERLVEGSAVAHVASVAALLADREIARREAYSVLREDRDPIEVVRARRARRTFYVERPTLLATNDRLERTAVEISHWLLDSLRQLPAAARLDSVPVRDSADATFARRLAEAGATALPAAPLAVTVKRHLPVVRAITRVLDDAAIARARNAEMLVAATTGPVQARAERRAVGRLLVSTAVAMRSQAQDRVWFPGDSAPTVAAVATSIGVGAITFDANVPKAWRPYFLMQLADGVASLRRVLPGLDLAPVRVRFRMTPPADSALAMHDPRTRTLHLPVVTTGGTLTHEIAHDLDRASAVRQGHQGYRSDFVSRNAPGDRKHSSGSVSASLRALTEEVAAAPRASSAERPAEIFATQVDWFVAQALASRGVSSGFLSAVQDELLTGHVVHPERLGLGSRSRVPLLDALRGMTTVAPFATASPTPSVHALVRWALSAAVDRGASTTILQGEGRAWEPPALDGAEKACAAGDDPRVEILAMAAESRARGWLRLRARRASDRDTPWARAATSTGPWSDEPFERRVAQLRDHMLLDLAESTVLPSGMAAHAAPLAALARCAR